MTNTPSMIGISLAPTLSDLDRATLRTLLERYAVIQDHQEKLGGAEWETFIAVLKDVGTLVTTGMALKKLATELSEWRKQVRQKGAIPAGKLLHPDRQPLDLATATDEEVLAWLLRQNP